MNSSRILQNFAPELPALLIFILEIPPPPNPPPDYNLARITSYLDIYTDFSQIFQCKLKKIRPKIVQMRREFSLPATLPLFPRLIYFTLKGNIGQSYVVHGLWIENPCPRINDSFSLVIGTFIKGYQLKTIVLNCEWIINWTTQC